MSSYSSNAMGHNADGFLLCSVDFICGKLARRLLHANSTFKSSGCHWMMQALVGI